MRQLSLGEPLSGSSFEQWVKDAFREIELASVEDVEQIISEFSVTGTYTESRTLDADTAVLGDVVNVICTLITDIKKRGQKRSYGT